MKRVSPLVLGLGDRGSTVASDAIALNGHADELIYLEDDQLAVLSAENVHIFDREVDAAIFRRLPLRSRTVMPWSISRDIRISCQRRMRSNRPRCVDLSATVRGISRPCRSDQDPGKVIVTGCGTAGNAALAATYIFDEICGRAVAMIPASEFRYRSRTVDSESLVIALSQSGETVDVLDAIAVASGAGPSWRR